MGLLVTNSNIPIHGTFVLRLYILCIHSQDTEYGFIVL